MKKINKIFLLFPISIATLLILNLIFLFSIKSKLENHINVSNSQDIQQTQQIGNIISSQIELQNQLDKYGELIEYIDLNTKGW